MRIAMLTGQHHDQGDKPGTQVMALATALAGRGHSVDVCLPTAGDGERGEEVAPGVRVEHTGVGTTDATELPAAYGAALRRRWASEPPDVVHAFTWSAGLAALLAAGDDPVPLVQDCRRADGELPQDADLARVETALGRRAQRTVVSGPHQADALAHRGVPRSGISVVPYGVDSDLYHPDARASRGGEQPRLVCPAGDGSDVVVHALPRVPDAELLVADRTTDDGTERLAESLGVADRVQVLCDLTDEDLAELYRSAALVVRPTSTDTSAAACVEAMACGAPVVTMSADVRDDIVVDGVTGVVVPAGGTEQLADTLRDLLGHEPRRIAYGIAAADRATACYSWDRAADSAEGVYDDAVLRGRFTGTAGAGRYTGTPTRGTRF